ncbi:DUF7925 domain-containing protein [Anabaena azotica]|uniref:DUF7925 domain-containing protein n=1 Tax=Anabaena azotica FACHB-119 TaxID=947527 RepID=A0ABR8CXS6_9NOST|nr:hypothetical protein [Anabaena azotica]MBD2499294.1 hypothetical protein [Anabaena azotica FACHB-119]
MKSSPQITKTKKPKLYRALVAAAFLANGILPFAAPVFAEGTAAGKPIENRATGTYEDPNNPGTRINTTSNTVTVTVAEVAGITVTASGVVDNNGGSVAVGDLLIYTYTLTNVGNDPTKFRIPNLASTTGPGSVAGTIPNGGVANRLQFSVDGGNSWQNITDAEAITPSVAPGGTVLVRVPVTVQVGAQNNDVITVTLGNTPGGAQNQLRNPDGGDVYTVDNPDDAPDEVDGAPVNGVREASATQQIQVGTSLKTYALATILKTRTSDDPGSDASTLTDDKLTYNLSLRVESNDVTGRGISPAPLTGTDIKLNGNPRDSRILISDAIPAGTRLAAVPVPPPGWEAVYTTDPVGTTIDQANWQTFSSPDSIPANVTRVGFINIPTSISAVAPGQTASGFSIQLAVTASTSPVFIANIAQVYGKTSGTDTLVYDESGDENPSYFDGNRGSMNLPALIDPDQVGLPKNNDLVRDNITSGFINNPTTPETGVDTENNNSGEGIGGEANQIQLQVALPVAVLNGPQNAPDAIGPTDNNNDFTNKSALVPANTAPGSLLDPSPVAFTNTIRNSGTNAGTITLSPTAPSNPSHLPNGTKVTITYGSQSAIYNYVFDNNNNTGSFNLVGTTAISIPNVAPGTNLNYGVEVDLPDGTPLSTDINIDRGFPVPIEASIRTAPNSSPETNTTINRVYTGYLRLVKESRILQGTGPVVQGNDGTFSSTPKRPAPGNIIEYQIRYKNISTPQAGSGNVILDADKIVITDDGTISPNNWALDNDNNGQIDTSNIAGSAKDSGASTITFFSGSGDETKTPSLDQTGTTVNSDVTKYVNTVTGKVGPNVERTFTFQRRVN